MYMLFYSFGAHFLFSSKVALSCLCMLQRTMLLNHTICNYIICIFIIRVRKQHLFGETIIITMQRCAFYNVTIS